VGEIGRALQSDVMLFRLDGGIGSERVY